MGRPLSDPVRNAEIIRLFRSGMTAREICSHYSMTPSGIFNVLDRFGIDREEGGKAEMARRRKSRRLIVESFETPMKFLEKCAAPLSAFESINQMRAAHDQFRQQRTRAIQRSIQWDLTFAD